MIITLGYHKDEMMKHNPERQVHHKAFLLTPPDRKQGRTFVSHTRLAMG